MLLHDAVRPLVSQTIIAANVAALQTYEAVDTAIPSADTVIQVDGRSDGSDDRRAPPPPAAPRSDPAVLPAVDHPRRVREGRRRTRTSPPPTTARWCCATCPRCRSPWSPGHERNMKVTEPIDVYIADKLFQLTSADHPAAAVGRGVPRPARRARRSWSSAARTASAATSPSWPDATAPTVKTFSRSTTDTHVRAPRATSPRPADEVLAETGRIDFVVNTAGVLPRGELAETTEETIYAATDVNYLAPIFIAQEFFPTWPRRGGSLLLFTSSSYTRGRSGYSLYSSAKAAVVNLTQALADEWAGAGVRVNCINPERTGTPMRTKAFGEEPPGTLLSSEEVARQSLDVLLSGQTGHIIDIRREDGPAALGNG